MSCVRVSSQPLSQFRTDIYSLSELFVGIERQNEQGPPPPPRLLLLLLLLLSY
jgi:hypothetical protein